MDKQKFLKWAKEQKEEWKKRAEASPDNKFSCGQHIAYDRIVERIENGHFDEDSTAENAEDRDVN